MKILLKIITSQIHVKMALNFSYLQNLMEIEFIYKIIFNSTSLISAKSILNHQIMSFLLSKITYLMISILLNHTVTQNKKE